MGRRLTYEEKVAHGSAVLETLMQPQAQRAMEVLMENLSQLIRVEPDDPLLPLKAQLLSVAVANYACEIASLSRYRALGIDPEDAKPTEEEKALEVARLRMRLDPRIAVRVKSRGHGQTRGPGGSPMEPAGEEAPEEHPAADPEPDPEAGEEGKDREENRKGGKSKGILVFFPGNGAVH